MLKKSSVALLGFVVVFFFPLAIPSEMLKILLHSILFIFGLFLKGGANLTPILRASGETGLVKA